LRKINCFFFIPHHAERARINLVTMTGDQLLKRSHVTLLRAPHQFLIVGGGMIFITHRFDAGEGIGIRPELHIYVRQNSSFEARKSQ
jgi:hypothetical protein